MTRIGGADYRPAYERNPAGQVDEKKKIENNPEPSDGSIQETSARLESGMGDDRGRQPRDSYKQKKPYQPGDIVDKLL